MQLNTNTVEFTLGHRDMYFGICQFTRLGCFSTSAIWPSGTAGRLQILCDGFDSRLEPIIFDMYNGWLLTRRAQAHFADSSITVEFLVQYYLKIISVVYLKSVPTQDLLVAFDFIDFC